VNTSTAIFAGGDKNKINPKKVFKQIQIATIIPRGAIFEVCMNTETNKVLFIHP
jgi:hypothetical protein